MSLIINTNIDIKNNLTEIYPIGEIDIYTSPKFKATVLEIIENNNQNIVIDCDQLGYIDSTGLGVIIFIYKKLLDKKLTIKLKKLKPNIYKLFNITNLDKVIDIEKIEDIDK